MERPYLDKWKQYLLREAKGPEKPPYFENIYGGIRNVTTANAKEVTKTMSRILKQTVTIKIPTEADLDPGSNDFRTCINSKGEIIYKEYDRLGETFWQQAYFTDNNSYYWGVDGQHTVIDDYDKDWTYSREIEPNGKTKYSVARKDNAKLKMNRQLMRPQNSGASYVELRPGTKAYNAVKRDVFKD